MWGRKKQPEVVTPPVETTQQYWAKRDAERAARKAEQATGDCVDDWWDGYGAPPALSPDQEDLLFRYELSAYSDTVGYYSDGVQRVSPVKWAEKRR